MHKNTKIILMGAVLFSLFIPWRKPAYAETLYVFYPSVTRSQILEKEIGKACPGVDIIVFGRYRDFKAKVGTDSPDAVLTKKPVIEAMGGYTEKMKGIRNGSWKERYILLSVDRPITHGEMPNSSIGAFDILGRKGMKKFVKSYLGPTKKIKRVSKMEDMLQLLIFNMSDALLIPEVFVPYFNEMSELNFVVTPAPKMQIGIIALAIKEGGNAPLSVKGIRAMNQNTKTLLEVDNWK